MGVTILSAPRAKAVKYGMESFYAKDVTEQGFDNEMA